MGTASALRVAFGILPDSVGKVEGTILVEIGECKGPGQMAAVGKALGGELGIPRPQSGRVS